MNKNIEIPNVCTIDINGTAECYKIISAAIEEAANNFTNFSKGEVVSAKAWQKKKIYDCNGPSWSHSSYEVLKETHVTIKLLSEIEKQKVIHLFNDGWWTKDQKMNFGETFYGGAVNTQIL